MTPDLHLLPIIYYSFSDTLYMYTNLKIVKNTNFPPMLDHYNHDFIVCLVSVKTERLLIFVQLGQS